MTESEFHTWLIIARAAKAILDLLPVHAMRRYAIEHRTLDIQQECLLFVAIQNEALLAVDPRTTPP